MFSRIQAFVGWYRPYVKTLVLVLFSALAFSGLTLLIPLITRYITKDILEGDPAQAPSRLLLTGLVMLAVIGFQILFQFIFDIRGHVMGAAMERDMRDALFAHLSRQSFSFFDRTKTGSLMSRLTGDLLNIAELAHHVPEDILVNVTRFVGAMIILFWINAKLTLGILLFLPGLIAFSIYFNGRMRKALAVSRERIAEVNNRAEDALGGIRTVQAFTNEALERKRFAETGRLFFESRRAIYRNESYNATGVEALVRLLTGAVTVFGALAITRQTLDLPDLITFLLYIGSLTDPVMRLVYTSLTYQNGMAGFIRFQDMMSQEPDIKDRPDARDLEIRQGDIRFDQVTFRYQGTARPVLANLDLEIRAGETVALVGPSGAGKTTLCSLIPRFYDVEAGSVRIDGVEVRDVRLASLRGAIGIVQQDVFLFAGTVAENIRYGNPVATDAELVEAARQSGAHTFIEKLPRGYDTEVGERGVRLSGGQKQRISLARVFLKNPPILIFDEATSALDLESEREIRASMARLASGRTTLIIAHRLSTVRNADRLVVLTDDGIEEQGTHEELLRAGGTYARLYGAQVEIEVATTEGMTPGDSPLFAQADAPEASPA